MMHLTNTSYPAYIIFFTLGFETTQQRSNMACVGFCNPHTKTQLHIARPYVVPCAVGGTVYFSQYITDGLWFPVPVTWNTNTRATFTGVITCSD